MAQKAQTVAPLKEARPFGAGAAESVLPPQLQLDELERGDEPDDPGPAWSCSEEGAGLFGSEGTFFAPSPFINVTPGTFPLIVQVPLSAVKNASPRDRHTRGAGAPSVGAHAPQGTRQPISVDLARGVQMHQIDIPHTATVADVKWRVQSETGLTDVKLLFDQQELAEDAAPLSSYNIPSAYNAASSLLWTIEEAGLSAGRKSDALEPALAVVNGVRRGAANASDLAELAVSGSGLSLDADASELPPLAPRRSAPRDASSAASGPGVSTSDYTTVLSKLGKKLPHLYTKDAVKAMSTAMRTPGPPQPPPSALARMSTWGETWGAQGSSQADDGVGNPADRAASNGLERQSTGIWLRDLAREWERNAPLEKVKEEEFDINGELNEDDANDDDDEDQDAKAENSDAESARDHSDSGLVGEHSEYDTGASSNAYIAEKDASSSAALHAQPVEFSAELVKVPKKRGRKRKNPELTEEERLAERKMQNRASAKKSRERKKVQTVEHAKRIESVLSENQTLKAELERLSKRLDLMQQLLTVQVLPNTSNP